MADRIFSDKSVQGGQMDLGRAMREKMQELNLNPSLAAIKQMVLADTTIQEFITNNQVTPTIVNRDFAVLYEYFNQQKRAQSGQAVVHQGYRPVLTLSADQIVILYQPDEQTIASQKLKAQGQLVQAIGMPKMIERARLADYDAQADAGRQVAFTQVVAFITEYLANPKDFHRGLYLHGSYGIGKTYLMAGMANQFASAGVAVTLVHFPTFTNEMKGAIETNKVAEKLAAVKVASILVLDDIGAESMSAWIRDDILGVILEYRMQNELPTFFTSNFSMAQLEKEHLLTTRDGQEPVKAERLMQRIKYLAKEVMMSGSNRRLTD